MISYTQAKKYCGEDISLIENYEAAATDTSEIWDIHHKREITDNKSKRQLIKDGLYYGVPACELVFLTRAEHIRIHQIERMKAEENRIKLSKQAKGENNPMYGHQRSDETKEKISNTRINRIKAGLIKVDTSSCHTDEANRKISEKAKARLANPANHPLYGTTYIWVNDGFKNFRWPKEKPVPANLSTGMIKKNSKK